MKTKIKNQFMLMYWTPILLMVTALSFNSCSKDNSIKPTSNNYCNRTEWSNTIGLSGYFDGNVWDNVYHPIAIDIVEDDSENYQGFTRDENDHLLNVSPNLNYTYTSDHITKIVQSDGQGTVTFNFDTNGHLISTDIESTDEEGTTTLHFDYTYNNDGDPVIIEGNGSTISPSGNSSAAYIITADYLTDKPGILAPVPEITPFTIYFAYTYFLSKHLINKWQIHMEVTPSGGEVPPLDFTQQYSYTFDSKGMVATMVHSLNSNNVFSFTYSSCH